MIDAAASPALLLLAMIDAIAGGTLTETPAVTAKIEELKSRAVVTVTEDVVPEWIGDEHIDDCDEIIDWCPACKVKTPHWRTESFNFGNQMAICHKCETGWRNLTEVDHKMILAEARKGF